MADGGGVDRGGLNYPIRASDEFSETLDQFIQQIRAAKREFSDFRSSVGGSNVNVRVFSEIERGNDRVAASIRRRKKAEEELAGSLPGEQSGGALPGAQAANKTADAIESAEKRKTAAVRAEARERERIRREEERDLARSAREAENLIARFNKGIVARNKNGILSSGEASRPEDAGRVKNAFAAEKQARVADQARTDQILRTDLQRVAAREAASKKLVSAQKAEAKALDEGSTSVEKQTKQVGLLDTGVGRLVKTVLVLKAIRTAFDFISTVKNAIFDFNSNVEDAKLGIASLLTAVGDVQDATGKTVSSSQGLALAQKEAARQTQLLRKDALATSATFEELAQAFQQALGPGLTSGLNVDQVRQFTVQVTQAASALGLAGNQLSEEIRSILSGTIQARTTRIATALGISNDDIKRAKEAGVLSEFLEKKFAAFNLAGQESLKNFTTIISNLQDAFRSIVGEAGLGLFETVKGIAKDIGDSLLIKGKDNVLRPDPTVLQSLKDVLDTVNEIIKAIRTADDFFGGLGAAVKGVASATDLLKAAFNSAGAGILEVFRLLPDAVLKLLGTSAQEIEGFQFKLIESAEKNAKDFARRTLEGVEGPGAAISRALLGPQGASEAVKTFSQTVQDLPANFGKAGPTLDQFKESLSKIKEEAAKADRALALAVTGGSRLGAGGGGAGAGSGASKIDAQRKALQKIDDADAQARAKIEVDAEIARAKALEGPFALRKQLQEELNRLQRESLLLGRQEVAQTPEKIALEAQIVAASTRLLDDQRELNQAKNDELLIQTQIDGFRKIGDTEKVNESLAEQKRLLERIRELEQRVPADAAKVDSLQAQGADVALAERRLSVTGRIASTSEDLAETDKVIEDINKNISDSKEKSLSAEEERAKAARLASLPFVGTTGGSSLTGNITGSIAGGTDAVITSPVFGAALQGISTLITEAFDPNDPKKGLNAKFKDFFNSLVKNIPLFLFSLFTGTPLPGAQKGGSVGLASGGRVPAFGSPSLAHARAKGYYSGGGIRPAGLPSSDTTPIWATPGEVMMRLAAVSRYGEDALLRINAGIADPMGIRLAAGVGPVGSEARAAKVGFATGGLVGSAPSAPSTTVLPVLPTSPDTLSRLIAGGQSEFNRAVDERIRRAGGHR